MILFRGGKTMWKPTISSDELWHHGIKGQQWGKRNGPPYPLQYDQSVYDQADFIHKEASYNEGQTTFDLTQAVDKCGAKLHGLEHRLKTKKSIARKIDKIMKETGTKYVTPFGGRGISDALRYTVMSKDDDFVKNYETVKNYMQDHGYEETRCKNYWDDYRQGKVKHKAVQCNFKNNKTGYQFEVQFHTPSSQNAKDRKVPIYEKARKVGINPKTKERLEQQMVALAEEVNDPKDIYKIKSH